MEEERQYRQCPLCSDDWYCTKEEWDKMDTYLRDEF